MASLEYTERPELHRSILIAAFAGWPDASEGATRAVRQVARQLSARKFASIDGEEFFDLTQQRPIVSIDADGGRSISWPSSDFYAWSSGDESKQDLLLLSGIEPQYRWRAFTSHITEVAELCDVQLVVTLGALLDAVPHTRPITVTTSATTHDLGEGLEDLRFEPSAYQGPTGIMSILLDVMDRRGIPCASLWGHAPHYVQAKPNPNVARALLTALEPFLPAPIDTRRMERRGAEFTRRLTRALEDQGEVTRYVAQLEQRYDAEKDSAGPPIESGDAEPLIAELEEFLRRQNPGGEEGGPGV